MDPSSLELSELPPEGRTIPWLEALCAAHEKSESQRQASIARKCRRKKRQPRPPVPAVDNATHTPPMGNRRSFGFGVPSSPPPPPFHSVPDVARPPTIAGADIMPAHTANTTLPDALPVNSTLTTEEVKSAFPPSLHYLMRLSESQSPTEESSAMPKASEVPRCANPDCGSTISFDRSRTSSPGEMLCIACYKFAMKKHILPPRSEVLARHAKWLNSACSNCGSVNGRERYTSTLGPSGSTQSICSLCAEYEVTDACARPLELRAHREGLRE
ncbi:hypothetical protein DFH06DRAFT_1477845 [Mycena polygramma]|nr:hypothetical protein DFH06DRAFT_1477845 [Mycena polygramma]